MRTIAGGQDNQTVVAAVAKPQQCVVCVDAASVRLRELSIPNLNSQFEFEFEFEFEFRKTHTDLFGFVEAPNETRRDAHSGMFFIDIDRERIYRASGSIDHQQQLLSSGVRERKRLE